MRVLVIIWQVPTLAQHVHRKRIVRNVIRRRTNVRRVQQTISQVEVDVLLVRRRIAQLAMHRMENAQHVFQDIIWPVMHVPHVHLFYQIVLHVHHRRHARNVQVDTIQSVENALHAAVKDVRTHVMFKQEPVQPVTVDTILMERNV